MSNHRYSKFWWQDWHGDKALHACSVGARGFWMELLCIAHEGKPYGHVTINGEAATLRQMAASANCTEKDARKWLAELETSRVFSRTNDGVIWNRRMVKDMCDTETFREIGKRGGNPALKRKDNGGDNGPHNGGLTPTDNLNRSEAESEAESPSDAGARERAPRQAKVIPLVFFGSPQPDQPEPRRHATKGSALDSSAKAEPYGPVRSVDEQLAILRGEKSA